MKQTPSFGIVGATGAVGRTILQVLEQHDLRPRTLRLFASERSKGQKMRFAGTEVEVEALDGADFKGLDAVFFSAGTDISRTWCPRAAEAGAVVIDNSNAFRMEADVPLVVPEVNPHALNSIPRNIIANPNCSTIQMVVAIAPIHRVNPLKRIVVSTYQSVSGTGLEAVETLTVQSRAHLAGEPAPEGVYPHPIGFNLFPHIDIFLESGMCREEEKMVRETQKILEAPIPVCATTVRVPVYYAHSESVNLELSGAMTPDEARSLLEKAPGVVVMDVPGRNIYPTPLLAQHRDEVFVGRIRRDSSVEHGLNLWVVADNLRRGAATNGVLIFEQLMAMGRFGS
ncbi:MAG TPA: aspartate-semialdehyde dehydrogenase [Candidatus Ozemobacteraceae bacterium]|nr:aspartate-semialdehyde dehydrogenase [Candidatus Ozemobacteraceae bacterium]